ncbi:MAG: CHAT domain-containing protein [Kofleriaceae bacterium]
MRRFAAVWWASVAATLTVAGCHARAQDGCAHALATRDWTKAAARCAERPAEAQLAKAWLAFKAGSADEALRLVEPLVGTSVDSDAAYLAGYLRAQLGRGEDEARELMKRALAGFQQRGRHHDSARAASFLSRMPRPGARFEDALRYAELAVAEAAREEDPRALGTAATALAEVYEQIGMAEPARDAFFRAEESLRGIPADLAFTYLKHGNFLIDLNADDEIRAGLGYLAAARDMNRRAAGTGEPDHVIALAVALNRVAGLAQLGDVEAAAAEAAAIPTTDDPAEARRLALVKGYVAARRGALGEAEALFVVADVGEVELDYRWRIALELGRAHRRTGDHATAERYLREAVEISERLRAESATPELRPWVLGSRRAAHVELVGLLAEQGRAVDALAVAESLHARTWLDTVHASAPSAGGAGALLDARVRRQARAWPALAAPALLDRLGRREAVVIFVSGDQIWRVHVAAQHAEIVALSADDLVAITRFRESPGDAVVAARAATALLPAGIEHGEMPLYVVANGAAADLPFAALRPGGQLLIARRSVVRLPGLAALGCRTGTWTDERVFLGDAGGDLPRAADEVRREGGVTARIGPAADRVAFRSAARAALLHAAVHSRLTSRGSALALADGIVTAADILDEGLAPRTVVLTGCATSAGADGEGFDTFPSAFLAAGSRYVVATLRAVDDADAATVVRAYYGEPEGLGPVERLARAQRVILDRVPVEAWASFTVWGDAACGP